MEECERMVQMSCADWHSRHRRGYLSLRVRVSSQVFYPWFAFGCMHLLIIGSRFTSISSQSTFLILFLPMLSSLWKAHGKWANVRRWGCCLLAVTRILNLLRESTSTDLIIGAITSSGRLSIRYPASVINNSLFSSSNGLKSYHPSLLNRRFFDVSLAFPWWPFVILGLLIHVNQRYLHFALSLHQPRVVTPHKFNVKNLVTHHYTPT